MKIAIAQIDSHLSQFERNLQKHLQYIQLAQDAGAELIIFPEMSLTGYSLQDLALHQAIPVESPKLDPLRKASLHIDVIAGYPEKAEHSAYIASSYFSGGKVLATHRKCYLPINGMFNDSKDFKRGSHVSVFRLRNGHLASLLICRDIWHMDTVMKCAESGAEVIFAPSAVPLRSISGQGPSIAPFMERTIQGYAEKNHQFIVFANRVGFEEGICFYGGCIVADPFGKIVTKGPYLEEQLVLSEINWENIERKNRILPLSYEQQPYSAWSEEA